MSDTRKLIFMRVGEYKIYLYHLSNILILIKDSILTIAATIDFFCRPKFSLHLDFFATPFRAQPRAGVSQSSACATMRHSSDVIPPPYPFPKLWSGSQAQMGVPLRQTNERYYNCLPCEEQRSRQHYHSHAMDGDYVVYGFEMTDEWRIRLRDAQTKKSQRNRYASKKLVSARRRRAMLDHEAPAHVKTLGASLNTVHDQFRLGNKPCTWPAC